MGNALQAQDNITGAVEFYNYAMVLHHQYREAFHALLVVKCSNLKRLKHKEQVDAIMQNWVGKDLVWKFLIVEVSQVF